MLAEHGRRVIVPYLRGHGSTGFLEGSGAAPGFGPYDDVERRLASLPPISVRTITLDGKADGVVPATPWPRSRRAPDRLAA